jgi:hypothetical protein
MLTSALILLRRLFGNTDQNISMFRLPWLRLAMILVSSRRWLLRRPRLGLSKSLRQKWALILF